MLGKCTHYVHIMFTLCSHYVYYNIYNVCIELGTTGSYALVRSACLLSSGTGRTEKTRRQTVRCLFRHALSRLMAFCAKTAVEGTNFDPTLSRAYGKNVGYIRVGCVRTCSNLTGRRDRKKIAISV
jgi:hypothetical protein